MGHPLTEAETRKAYIDLLLSEAGWELVGHDNTPQPCKAGTEIKVTGMPPGGQDGYCDYVLYGKDGTPRAVVEAKRTSVSPGTCRKQVILYGERLAAQYGCAMPVLYYTNGHRIWCMDGLYPDRELCAYHNLDEMERLLHRRTRAPIGDFKINRDIAGRPYQITAVTALCDRRRAVRPDHHRRGAPVDLQQVRDALRVLRFAARRAYGDAARRGGREHVQGVRVRHRRPELRVHDEAGAGRTLPRRLEAQELYHGNEGEDDSRAPLNVTQRVFSTRIALMLALQDTAHQAIPWRAGYRKEIVTEAGAQIADLRTHLSRISVRKALPHLDNFRDVRSWLALTPAKVKEIDRFITPLVEDLKGEPELVKLFDCHTLAIELSLAETGSCSGASSEVGKVRKVANRLKQLGPIAEVMAKRAELENILWNVLGTKEQYEAERYKGALPGFVRSLVDIDEDAVQEKFGEFLSGGTLNQDQQEFVRTIIDYLRENGEVTTDDLTNDEPFVNYDIGSLFEDRIVQLHEIIDRLNAITGNRAA